MTGATMCGTVYLLTSETGSQSRWRPHIGSRNVDIYLFKQEAFEKCWAHSLLRAVLHCHSLGVATAVTVARRLCIDVHDDDDDDDNDNAWQRGPLWPHRMGPMKETSQAGIVSKQLHRLSVDVANMLRGNRATDATIHLARMSPCRACRRGRNEDATRKVLAWNSSYMARLA